MKLEERELRYQNYKIKYLLQRKANKNVTIKINEQGQLVVVANEYVPINKLEQLIIEKVSWIIEKQQSQMAKLNKAQEGMYLLDKYYPYVFQEAKVNNVKIVDEKIVVNYTDRMFIEKLLAKFIYQQSIKIIDPLVHKWLAIFKDYYNVEVSSVKYKYMKSKWGSCQTNKRIITLNYYLINQEQSFIEYVIVHELAHLIQPNHSKAFYQVIEKFMPDYRLHKNPRQF